MSFLISFFYIYDPWLFQFWRMSFFVGVFSILLLLIKKQKIYFPKKSTLMIISLILFSSIPVIVHNTGDYSVVLMYIKIFIMFVFGVSVYSLYYRQSSRSKFIYDLHNMVYIQSILGLLALVGMVPIINFLLSVHAPLEKFYESEQEYRLYSLTSSAFFQLSIFNAFLLHFVLAAKNFGYKISNILIGLIFFVGMLSGRTFIILASISVILYYLELKYMPLIVLKVILIVYLAINYSDNTYVGHALEPIINYLEDKDTVSSSTVRLEEMWFLPKLKQIIIGDGYYFTLDGLSYYGQTDVGFIRQLLYGGVLYLILCYYFMYFFIKKIAKFWFGNSRKFLYSTVFILSLAHMKADVYAYPGVMLFLIIFLSLFNTYKDD